MLNLVIWVIAIAILEGAAVVRMRNDMTHAGFFASLGFAVFISLPLAAVAR